MSQVGPWGQKIIILGTRRVGDGQKDSRVEGQMEDRQTEHLGQGP